MTLTQLLSPSINSRGRIAAERPGNPLANLRAIVLLSGSPRSQLFVQAIGRSVLDLPLDSHRTIMEHWHDSTANAAEQLNIFGLTLRIIVQKNFPLPVLPACCASLEVQIEKDPADFRGTGGLLRDICRDYDCDDYLVSASAAQIPLDPLEQLLQALAEPQDPVALLTQPGSNVYGLFLTRVGCLNVIPSVGFSDFKEQALPKIRQRHKVRIITRPGASLLHARTCQDYLRALRIYHQNQSGSLPGSTSPFAEDWQPVFSIVERGAMVHPDSRILDSVILRDARVGPNAVVVRSVVGPGGVVRERQTVVDQLIGFQR